MYFNPRSREGSDVSEWAYLPDEPISIHAPVKGATTRVTRSVPVRLNFNPRSREGSDRIYRRSVAADTYFNPRSREGSDYHRDMWGGSSYLISIHAPVKGATFPQDGYHFEGPFQSTLP